MSACYLLERDLDRFSTVLEGSRRDTFVMTGDDINLGQVPVAVVGLRPGAVTGARCDVENGGLTLALDLGGSAPTFGMAVATVDERGSFGSWQRLRVRAHEPGVPRSWAGRLELADRAVAVAVSTGGELSKTLDRARAATWWYRTGWLLDGLGRDPREAWMRAAYWWDSVGDVPRARAARSSRGDGRFRTPAYGLISELTRQADYLLASARRGDRSDAAVAAKVYRLISDFGGQAAAVDLEAELDSR